MIAGTFLWLWEQKLALISFTESARTKLAIDGLENTLFKSAGYVKERAYQLVLSKTFSYKWVLSNFRTVKGFDEGVNPNRTVNEIDKFKITATLAHFQLPQGGKPYRRKKITSSLGFHALSRIRPPLHNFAFFFFLPVLLLSLWSIILTLLLSLNNYS